MALQVQDFLREYEGRTDEELLRLALERDQLTADANRALSSELSRRGLDGGDRLQEFRAEEEDRRKTLERDTGRLFFPWAQYGFGRWRFCKWDRKPASHPGFEEFTTTVFVVVFGIPLVPTGTFRMRRRKGFGGGQLHVIERLPLNWAQVVMVWAATLSVFLAFGIALRALPLFIR
jgi:hypothetical protein